ncbi:hypothetical protein GCM10010440_50690 [Kitasatospora cinereorecta]
MRMRATAVGLLAALLALVLLSAGAAAVASTPRTAVPVAAAGTEHAEHQETEPELPAGVPHRSGPRTSGRPASGGPAPRLLPPAEPTAPTVRTREAGAPCDRSSRPTGGTAASVHQVLRC